MDFMEVDKRKRGVMSFMEANMRLPSKFVVSERVEMFKMVLEMGERYWRVNQYEFFAMVDFPVTCQDALGMNGGDAHFRDL